MHSYPLLKVPWIKNTHLHIQGQGHDVDYGVEDSSYTCIKWSACLFHVLCHTHK